ncbi:MAG: hypothetical protein CMJ85_13405 [Planctomycetes bacterium]|nr:hypothetical protein [Planctomycetota bacterium]
MDACPVCCSLRFTLSFEAAGHRFERCATCRFVRMADPLAPTELDGYYRDERGHAEGAYQEHDKNLGRFDEMLQRLERHCRPGRLLDIGCSIGTSLIMAGKRGWKATGIEVSRPAAEFGAKDWGLDIRCCYLADAGLEPASFDAILMNHTLEHVADPDEMVADASRLLRPGGVMYQSVPNFDSLKSRLLGRHWSYGVHSSHLSMFGKRTLSHMLRRLGLEVVQTYTASYAKDPRLLHDFLLRLNLGRVLNRWCNSEPATPETYVRFLAENRWAFWVCNHLWPERTMTALGLGEDLHVIARSVT